jgi:hypothetical protein
MVILDKRTVKMLRYIKRKDTPEASIIIKKFIKDGSDMELINLCREGYLLCIKDDDTYTDFKDEPLISSSSYKYWGTPVTTKYLEDLDCSFKRWMFPVVMSFISLVLSLITFLYTVLDKSPILIQILK